MVNRSSNGRIALGLFGKPAEDEDEYEDGDGDEDGGPSLAQLRVGVLSVETAMVNTIVLSATTPMAVSSGQ